jgi:cytoskeleton protein RodZ
LKNGNLGAQKSRSLYLPFGRTSSNVARMSGNKRKKAPPSPVDAENEPVMARLVAIPKAPEQTAAVKPEARPDAKTKPKSERIGDILRHARLERNEDLYQIADYLCIKPTFLVALENSRYDEFPADAYVIGFLRTYATFLGVDGKDAVDRYRYEMAGRRKKPVLSMPIPLTEGRAPGSLIMVGATVAVLLVYALWYGISSSNRAEKTKPPVLPLAQQSSGLDPSAAGLTAPVETQTAPPVPQPPLAPETAPVVTTISNGKASSASTITASSTTGIPPAAPGIVVAGASPSGSSQPSQVFKSDNGKDDRTEAANGVLAKDTKAADDSKKDDGKKQIYGDPDAASHLIIRATQSSWITITDASGKTIFDHVLKAGDIYKVPNKPGLSLTTGNGNGLDLLLDGAALPKIATGAPHTVKNISLDSDKLTVEPSSD